MRRTLALLLLLLFLPGCAKTLTNVVGDQRTCKVENMTAQVYICSGRDACGALGAVALLFTLIAVGAYHACVHQAHEEGYE